MNAAKEVDSPIRWSDPAYEAVARFVLKYAGLTFPSSRLEDLEAGVRRAMRPTGVQTPAEYARLLERGETSADDLIAELTVAETYFFRDPAHFEFIRREVLPGFRASAEPGRPVRVWSAGCASGEEAYSLAILLEEESLSRNAHLVATDVSRKGLVRARKAAYSPWSLRATDEVFARRYFRFMDGQWILDERFQKLVAFEYLNLAADSYPSFASGLWGMDLILCRNVLIYFDADTIRSVSRRLMQCLREGGWLLLGPSDPPLDASGLCETKITPEGVFYQRRRAGQPVSLPARIEAPRRPALGGRLTPEERSQPVLSPSRLAPPAGESLEEARKALSDGNYDAAARIAGRLSAASVEASVLHVRALANWRGTAEAARAAAAAVDRFPLSPELHLLRALLMIDLNDRGEAERSARKAVYLDRSLAIAHFVLGTILRREGDALGARREYRNAFRLCTLVSQDEILPLSEGESASSLAAAAKAQLALLEPA